MTILNAPAAIGQVLVTGDLYMRGVVPDDLDQILRLQETVWQALPEQQKSFLIHKGAEAFQGLLTLPNLGVGIFTSENQLVAQAFLKVSRGGGDLAGLTDSPAARLIAAQCGAFAVPQSVSVHPGYRGRHLMRAMLHALEEAADDIQSLVTEVTESNNKSAAGFLHDGYKDMGHDVDPADGTKLMFLRKNIKRMDKCPSS